jgi:type IV secretion system protein VirB6
VTEPQGLEIHLFHTLLSTSDHAVQGFVFGVWNQFQHQYGVAIAATTALCVAMLGYAVWTGFVTMTARDLTTRVLRVVVPFVLVTSQPIAERFVYHTVTDIPAEIGSVMLGQLRPDAANAGSHVDINEELDRAVDQGVGIAGSIWSKAGVLDVATLLVGGLMFLVVMIGMIPIALAVLLSKLAVGVLLALAPFMIALYFFDATRSLFEGWLRQTLTFALVPTMLYALLGLVLSMLAVFAGPLETQMRTEHLPSLGDIAPYLIFMVCIALLATQVIAWSGGIAGALALSVSTGILRAPWESAAAGARILQATRRGAQNAPAAETRKGKAAAFRTSVAQTVLRARSSASSGARHALGLRPERFSDPFYRPRPPKPPQEPTPSGSTDPSASDAAKKAGGDPGKS